MGISFLLITLCKANVFEIEEYDNCVGSIDDQNKRTFNIIGDIKCPFII